VNGRRAETALGLSRLVHPCRDRIPDGSAGTVTRWVEAVPRWGAGPVELAAGPECFWHARRVSVEASEQLVLLCGVSFAGKSTVAAVLAEQLGAQVVSLDAVNAERGLSSGQGIPVEEWERTHGIAGDRVRSALAAGRVVVVDDTSSLRSLRDRWREVAQQAGAGFTLVWVRVDRAEMARRLQANRSAPTRHDVVDSVLTQFLADFEAPTEAEGAVELLSDDRLSDQVTALTANRFNDPRPAHGPGK